ncbi:flagellar biosynthesis repressor FlbT [Parvularcula oceani]|uniref:flagellar biosynthesis repressor FlbT n=1 Tax=Parvularcula oceani TaxID=1247963 RepID=UPI00055BEC24|nr:flagellar biosynthesis repressor FlbT [Parvularcula oceani]
MAGLTLTLRPNERFLVGGCLVQNGPRRSAITIVDDSVPVLRLSDALHPDEVTTPIRRAYYAAQLILAGEPVDRDAVRDQIEALARIFETTPLAPKFQEAKAAAETGRYHSVLMTLRPLFAVEDEMLSSGDEKYSATG